MVHEPTGPHRTTPSHLRDAFHTLDLGNYGLEQRAAFGRWWVWPSYDRILWETMLVELALVDRVVLLSREHRRHNATFDRPLSFIQAGAACGMVPWSLSKQGVTVVAFEPDRINHLCAVLNLYDTSRISLMNAALGDTEGFTSIMQSESANAGSGRLVKEVEVGTPMTPVACHDIYRFAGADAVWLDVEGYETPLVERILAHPVWRPMIVVEMKGHGSHYGFADSSLAAELAGCRYKLAAVVGNDHVYSPYDLS